MPTKPIILMKIVNTFITQCIDNTEKSRNDDVCVVGCVVVVRDDSSADQVTMQLWDPRNFSIFNSINT